MLCSEWKLFLRRTERRFRQQPRVQRKEAAPVATTQLLTVVCLGCATETGNIVCTREPNKSIFLAWSNPRSKNPQPFLFSAFFLSRTEHERRYHCWHLSAYAVTGPASSSLSVSVLSLGFAPPIPGSVGASHRSIETGHSRGQACTSWKEDADQDASSEYMMSPSGQRKSRQHSSCKGKKSTVCVDVSQASVLLCQHRWFYSICASTCIREQLYPLLRYPPTVASKR